MVAMMRVCLPFGSVVAAVDVAGRLDGGDWIGDPVGMMIGPPVGRGTDFGHQ
jgi:hypothetical protein